jgi:trigger factor
MSEQTELSERLKSSMKDLSASRKEIEAELRADEVDKELQVIIDQYAGRAKLKGFRQGKAPRDMVKQMFQADIHKSLLDSLVPKVLEEVLNSYNIHPASVPRLSDLSYDEGKPLHFRAVVEVWPDFELPTYKKIQVKKKESIVEDKDIDQALEELRQKSAEYIPVEGRGVVIGDYVVAELQGKDLKTKRLMPAEKVIILAGQEGNEKIINENLIGLKPLEEKVFLYPYPADYKNKKLAGKEIEYRIKVISIKAKQVPSLDDDFAKNLGETDNLADLRDKVKKELQAVREDAARREAAEDILKTLVDKTEIEIPPGIIEEEAQAVLKSLLSSAPQQNITKEVVDKLRPEAAKQAEVNLKRHLILREIAKSEDLKVGEEEVDAEIRVLAKTNNLAPAQAMAAFNQEGRRESLKKSLLLRKAIDFLVGQAIIDN